MDSLIQSMIDIWSSCSARRVGIESRITSVDQITMERLPDGLQVIHCFLVSIDCPVEIVERFGSVQFSSQQVIEWQAKFLDKLANPGVTLIDQLAPVFGDLAFVKITAACPATAPNSRVGLVNRRDNPRLL